MPRHDDRPSFFGYLMRLLLMLLLIAALGFLAFAYFGDLEVAPERRILPVDLGTG